MILMIKRNAFNCVSGLAYVPGFALWACLATLQAGELSVQAAKAAQGQDALVTIDYAAQGTPAAAAVQFDLRFDSSRLAVEAEAGEAASAAGKTLSTSVIEDGRLRIIISGVNQDAIGDGRLALLTVAVGTETPVGDYAFLLSDVSATADDGQPVAASALNGALTVTTAAPPVLIFPQYAEGTVDGLMSRTRIILRNNSDQGDNGAVQFFDSAGECQEVPVGGFPVSSVPFELGPWSSIEVVTDGSSGSLLSGAVTVHSEKGDESALEATLVFTVLGDHFVSLQPSPPRGRHQIYVSFDSLENTGLALFNPGEAMVTLDLALLDASGTPQAEPLVLDLGPGEHLAAFLDQPAFFQDFLQALADFKGTLNIGVRQDGVVSLLGLIQRRDTGALIAVASSPNAAP